MTPGDSAPEIPIYRDSELNILSNELTLDSERQLLRTLLERVGQRCHTEREIESRHAGDISAEEKQYQSVFQLLTETYDQERTRLEQTRESQLADSDLRFQTESAKVQAEYQRVLAEAESRYTRDTTATTKEYDESVWLVSSLLDDDTEGSPLHRLHLAQANYAAAEVELKTGMDSLEQGYEQALKYLQRSHMWSEPVEPEPTVALASVEEMKSACLQTISASEPIRRRILGRFLPLLFIGPLPFVLFLICTGAVFGLVWGLVDPHWLQLKLNQSDRDWIYISTGIGAAFSLLSVLFFHLYVSYSVWPDYEELLQKLIDARHVYGAWQRTSLTDLNMLEAECVHLQELRVNRRETAITTADSKKQSRLAEIQRQYTTVHQHAVTVYPARLNELEARRDREREQIETSNKSASHDLIYRREADFRRLQSEFDARMNEHRRRYQQAWTNLIQQWQSDLRQLGHFSQVLRTAAASICPAWETIAEDQKPFPTVSPPVLSLGQMIVDLEMVEGGLSPDPRMKTELQRFDLPILLPLLDHPSLVIRTNSAGRDAAVKTLQSTMLRFLTSMPPGKVRFTIFDPVGLGVNFNAFMHLADYDELLITSRIWTEPSHIEKKLADLTEHMETVLQTYLRNEFATIDEYNQFAGEVAEPYRVLVVANFPVNFTDIALRRLASIAEGGQRCGVHLLLSFDQSQELPRGFNPADVEKHATVLEWTDNELRLADEEFSVWPLALDEPPPAESFGQIVRLAGQHSREVRRVEVPFERVAPAEAAFWSSDSRSGIDVPIGRAGATKLQHLRLGKGTSQHVLVAGKTGSGKSTLLHALITNLALYYSPTEVEFYLIDFKKGVEFKVYAEKRLPHARVIAIESDREFGVSVLERLDTLLRDRGELFREAGVQDIAGYRNAKPDAILPRTLLLVDEFQEFFIEDDAISQKASLLLDRLIRQGRAFGVHILLGSQTLAGAYSLARSTLGQVAVRIALQCSDTDAHLILSEENTAARLLTRPGEAIYNDANGLVEGNHPFQIVWLGEEQREGYLNAVRSEADGAGSRGKSTEEIINQSRTPPLVFEGNIPADPTTNRRLQRLLQKQRSELDSGSRQPAAAFDSNWTCWLGDSVSLSGPLELNFGLREGGNVLVVGRDESAALGVMSSCALALGAQAVIHGQAATAIHVLDGSLPESPSAQTWRALSSIWTTSTDSSNDLVSESRAILQIGNQKETNRLLSGLLEELRRRADEPGSPMFLFVFDLVRFRGLKKADEDYSYGGFGGGGEKPFEPAQAFAEILRDGPSAGIFTIVWVDSYQSAQRWLSREQMNRFDQRILFAMNSNDSSSLIDSPLAGKLGENRALIYRGDTGTIEKFRPYSPPPVDWLRRQSPSASAPARGIVSAPAPNPDFAANGGVTTEVAGDSVTKPVAPTFSDQTGVTSFDQGSFNPPSQNSPDELSDELPSIDEMNVQ